MTLDELVRALRAYRIEFRAHSDASIAGAGDVATIHDARTPTLVLATVERYVDGYDDDASPRWYYRVKPNATMPWLDVERMRARLPSSAWKA